MKKLKDITYRHEHLRINCTLRVLYNLNFLFTHKHHFSGANIEQTHSQ